MEGVEVPLPPEAPATLAYDNDLESSGGDEKVSRTEGVEAEDIAVTGLGRK